MQKTRTLASVAEDVRLSIIIATLMVCMISIAGHFLIVERYRTYADKVAARDLTSTLHIYQSNLLNRIGIVASATEFMEFVRSGELTRTHQEREFIGLMSRMPNQEIEGWNIINNKGDSIFTFGASTDNVMIIPLCYLGDVLDAVYGNCIGKLYAYLSAQSIQAHLMAINDKLYVCEDCAPLTRFPPADSDILNPQSRINVRVAMKSGFDATLFLIFEAISIVSFVLVFLWIAHHIRRVIDKEILRPLVGISTLGDPAQYEESSVDEIIDIRTKWEVLQARTLAEEEERRSLADEIHDSFGGVLFLLKTKLERLRGENNSDTVDNILSDVDRLHVITRNFIEGLKPELLDTLGLEKAIESMVEEWARNNVTCDYQITLKVDAGKVTDIVAHAAYRICQESLTNIFKHAEATEAHITLETRTSESGAWSLWLEIRDNGVGFVAGGKAFRHGHGLGSIRQRAVSLGGKCTLHTSRGKGTTLSVVLPLQYGAL